MPFVLFSKAITALAAQDAWRPDVIHCNDWHCGLVAQEARQGPHRRTLERTGIVFTIHNIAYQGRVGAATDLLIGLAPAGTLLERGIAFADRVNTVSPRLYAGDPHPGTGSRAGRTSPQPRRHRTGHPQWRRLRGIQPGAGSLDRHPLQRILRGRQTAPTRKSCSGSAAWSATPDRPLFGMVARLVSQKGVGLLSSALDQFVARGAQVVVMGEGAPRYRRELQAAARRHAGNMAFHPTSQESAGPTGLRRLGFLPCPVRLRALRPDSPDRPAVRHASRSSAGPAACRTR